MLIRSSICGILAVLFIAKIIKTKHIASKKLNIVVIAIPASQSYFTISTIPKIINPKKNQKYNC